MFYQVRANIYFIIQDEATDFYHDCELALLKGGIINPDSQNLEFSTIELINNNHDQEPNQPCEVIASKDNHPEH